MWGLIDRFRVESMESSDSEIKASAAEAAGKSLGKASKNFETSPLHSTKRKSYLRSQSATTSSKSSVTKDEKPKEGSFAVSQENLTTEKTSSTEPIAISGSSSSHKSEQDEPLLTLASSLKDNSNITIGFNVKDDAKSNE